MIKKLKKYFQRFKLWSQYFHSFLFFAFIFFPIFSLFQALQQQNSSPSKRGSSTTAPRCTAPTSCSFTSSLNSSAGSSGLGTSFASSGMDDSGINWMDLSGGSLNGSGDVFGGAGQFSRVYRVCGKFFIRDFSFNFSIFVMIFKVFSCFTQFFYSSILLIYQWSATTACRRVDRRRHVGRSRHIYFRRSDRCSADGSPNSEVHHFPLKTRAQRQHAACVFQRLSSDGTTCRACAGGIRLECAQEDCTRQPHPEQVHYTLYPYKFLPWNV